MKILRYRLCPTHRAGVRKMRVHAAYPGRIGTDDGGIEMDDLARGMHTGVGAPGTHHMYRRIGDLT